MYHSPSGKRHGSYFAKLRRASPGWRSALPTTRTGRAVCAVLLWAFFSATGCAECANDTADGWVVVVNLDDLSGSTIALTTDKSISEPGDLIRQCRSAGLRVLTDPTGRIVAATGLSRLLADASKYTDLSDRALAAAILHQCTPEQLVPRDKGYISLENLTQPQAVAAREIARRRGLIEAIGSSTNAGAHLCVGMWSGWTVHLVGEGQTGMRLCRKLDVAPSLPTEGVIASPYLSGSPLWFAWSPPARTADEKGFDVRADTYTIGDLAKRLSSWGTTTITADSSVSNTRIFAAAVGAPLRNVLWALGVATGLQTEDETNPTGVTENLVPRGAGTSPTGASRNSFLPVPQIGYYSAADSPVGRTLLFKANDHSGRAGEGSRIWILSDLPLLYQNEINEAWKVTSKHFGESNVAFSPEHTFVLWTQSITVSVELQSADGAGSGVEFAFPVL